MGNELHKYSRSLTRMALGPALAIWLGGNPGWFPDCPGYTQATNSRMVTKRNDQRNVLGTELKSCSFDPLTGFTRSGSCEGHEADFGCHAVCAQVTEQFLEFSRLAGNDLSTPRPEYEFPGLKPGDRWCVCAARWEEARLAGKAPPVILESTHAAALEHVQLAELRRHALDVSG